MSLLQVLRADVGRQHHFAGTPKAVYSNLDVFKGLLSPRFVPVVLFRLSHWSATHHLRPFGKLFSLLNFVLFGLEIGQDCEIGPGLYFPHTSGTVLGARRIGCNAVIYHNVTIGAKFPDLVFDQQVRPELGDDVLLGSGAKVLGPILIGHGSIVAANSVVVHDVPPESLVTGIPGRATAKKASPPPVVD